MTTFVEWFIDLQDKASQTADGIAFINSNFELSHQGGGTTAWFRDIDDTDWHILITDSEGCSHDLTDEGEDYYLIGGHNAEGKFTGNCQTAATAEEAIRLADEMHERIAKGDLEGLDVQ
jgi:hypothetical protein